MKGGGGRRKGGGGNARVGVNGGLKAEGETRSWRGDGGRREAEVGAAEGNRRSSAASNLHYRSKNNICEGCRSKKHTHLQKGLMSLQCCS